MDMHRNVVIGQTDKLTIHIRKEGLQSAIDQELSID